MAADEHRASILNCELNAIGVDFDPRGNYCSGLRLLSDAGTAGRGLTGRAP
jgi:hypothetical protein